MSHTEQCLGDEWIPIVGRVAFVNSGHAGCGLNPVFHWTVWRFVSCRSPVVDSWARLSVMRTWPAALSGSLSCGFELSSFVF